MDNPNIEHPALSAFAEVAADLCHLVEERRYVERAAFIHALHLLLASAYAAALRLPSIDVLYNDDDDEEDDDNDDDEPDEQQYVLPPRDVDRLKFTDYHELRTNLAVVLGDETYYREVFDPWKPAEDNPEVTGSLADDIADAYRDLKSGLLKWQRGESGAALFEWRYHLETHWGEHATGALRALHTRAAWHSGGWPS
jgi:hypothetical protein